MTAAAGIAVGVALILASVSSAYAKAPAAYTRATQARPPAAVTITISHHPSAVKFAPVAHAAGHKIA